VPLRAALSLIGALALIGCGGGTGDDAVTPPPQPPGIYVSASDGNDLGDGSPPSPLKTLTAALAMAGPGDTVYAAPGTYDVANGEVFPLLVPADVTVEGDVPNRGVGVVPTLVSGAGVETGMFATHACVALGEGASVRGLQIQAGSTTYAFTGALIEDATAEVADCTFAPGSYVGIVMTGSGASQFHDNTFQTSSYGIYLVGASSDVTVQGNTFDGPSYGIDMVGALEPSILDNHFGVSTAGPAGIQVQSSSPWIEGNTFGPSTFGTGACVVTIGSPVFRGNTFTGDIGVLLQPSAQADLGTVASPGLNSFAGLTGFAVKHEGGATVQAQGNTWQHAPPIAGQDIVVTGAGSVVYGPGASDKVP
jgi:parallel beta-helix repeat protein